MKKFLIVLFFTLPFVFYGQYKYDFTHINNLMEVKGTEYVIASIKHEDKISKPNKESYLLFINTHTSEIKRVDFPDDTNITDFEQVIIDSLDINSIIVLAQTIDLDGKKGIGWDDPKQIIILSPNGEKYHQLTPDSFFVQKFVVNNNTGTIIVTGSKDSNNNKKLDKSDESKILIYDLKTLQLMKEI